MKNLLLILLALLAVYMFSKKRAATAAAAAVPAAPSVDLSTTETPVTGSPAIPQPGMPNVVVINSSTDNGYANDIISGENDFNTSGTFDLPA